MKIKSKLWKKLKKYITLDDLVEISKSDCERDVKEHYSALLDIYENNRIPFALGWEPCEVISLTRWSDYSKGDKKQVILVLFCAFLLLETTKTDECVAGSNSNIILAIDCANLLGYDWLELLQEYIQSLYFKINKEVVAEEIIYFSLGLAIISLLTDDHNSFIRWAEITVQNIELIEEEGWYKGNECIFSYTFFDQTMHIWEKYLSDYEKEIKGSPLNKVLTLA